jgi:C4-dicarboxylate-specific signal transduction histidine kinase
LLNDTNRGERESSPVPGRSTAQPHVASLAALSFEDAPHDADPIEQVRRRKPERSLCEAELLPSEQTRAERASRNIQADIAHVARLATMGELVASIGHELSQPLAVVVISAETALKRLEGEQPDLTKLRATLEHILSQGSRAAEMLQGLRRLTRMSPPALSELSMDDVIRDVIALTTGERRLRGVKLSARLRGGAAVVLGDRIQLQQVVLNLIMNAMDAMNGIDDRARTITISSDIAPPDRMLVSVEDTGTGLDLVTADQIFDSFFTTKAEGMGLGLSICRSIVETHGGRIQAAPRQPHGAAFHVTLPARRVHGAA